MNILEKLSIFSRTNATIANRRKESNSDLIKRRAELKQLWAEELSSGLPMTSATFEHFQVRAAELGMTL